MSLISPNTSTTENYTSDLFEVSLTIFIFSALKLDVFLFSPHSQISLNNVIQLIHWLLNKALSNFTGFSTVAQTLWSLWASAAFSVRNHSSHLLSVLIWTNMTHKESQIRSVDSSGAVTEEWTTCQSPISEVLLHVCGWMVVRVVMFRYVGEIRGSFYNGNTEGSKQKTGV